MPPHINKYAISTVTKPCISNAKGSRKRQTLSLKQASTAVIPMHRLPNGAFKLPESMSEY
jgi:hypothetical protein